MYNDSGSESDKRPESLGISVKISLLPGIRPFAIAAKRPLWLVA
jgi:hypothetical protein